MGKRQELLLRRHVQHTGDVNSKGETCNGKEATLWRGSEGQLESPWKKSLRIIPGASHPARRVVVPSWVLTIVYSGWSTPSQEAEKSEVTFPNSAPSGSTHL